MTLELIQKQSQQLADLVVSTLGPRGRSILISRPDIGEPARLTKDGATVARLYNKQNAGSALLKEASQRAEALTGDGTTTSSLLANELIQGKQIEYQEAEALIKASEDAIEFLTSISQKVDSLKNVAKTSLNNDEKSANLIASAFEVCNAVQVVPGTEDNLTIINGARFESGWLSPYFCINSSGKTITYTNPLVLAVDGVLDSPDQLIQALETANKLDKPLIILASDIQNQALQMLIANHTKNAVKCVAARVPGYGNVKSANTQDIALMVSGKPISVKNSQLAVLGTCDKFTIDDKQFFINFAPNSLVSNQFAAVSEELKTTNSPFVKGQILDRLSRLTGKIAQITISATSETALQERRDRFDDALGACRAALRRGVLPGGGSALLQAANYLKSLTSGGAADRKMREILSQALKSQLHRICANAGASGRYAEEILSKESSNCVYDVVGDKFGDFQELGIVDAADVVIEAVRSAVELSSQVLRIGGGIIDEERKQ